MWCGCGSARTPTEEKGLDWKKLLVVSLEHKGLDWRKIVFDCSITLLKICRCQSVVQEMYGQDLLKIKPRRGGFQGNRDAGFLNNTDSELMPMQQYLELETEDNSQLFSILVIPIPTLVHALLYLNMLLIPMQLHELGARRFLLHNMGPLGCLPVTIDKHPSNYTDFDELGCIKSSNEIARKFNQLLTEKVYLLRTKLEDSTLVYVDIYSAKYSLFRDAKRYGFVDPFGYCCKGCLGSETPYWNRTIGNPTVVPTACDDPSKYISWDRIHYTEAANHLLANQIFDGSILDPLVNLSPK